MILTKHAAKVAARKEHAPTSIMALNARLLAEMWADIADLDVLRTDEAVARLLVAVHRT